MITKDQAERAHAYIKKHPGTSWPLALAKMVEEDSEPVTLSNRPPPVTPPQMAMAEETTVNPDDFNRRAAALEAEHNERKIAAAIKQKEAEGHDPFSALLSVAQERPELFPAAAPPASTAVDLRAEPGTPERAEIARRAYDAQVEREAKFDEFKKQIEAEYPNLPPAEVYRAIRDLAPELFFSTDAEKALDEERALDEQHIAEGIVQ